MVMSGRDLRNFVTLHRGEDSEKLVQRVKSGIGSSKYKQVDYEQLKALAKEKKLSGQEALMKVKKLQQTSKQGKEQHLVKQHKLAWHKEFLRLNSIRQKTEADIDLHTQHCIDTELLQHVCKDFSEYENQLTWDFNEFKRTTSLPVWNLRKDLQIWLQEYRQGMQSPGIQMDNSEAVRDTLDSIKLQQEAVLKRLRHEQASLETDLQMGDLPDSIHCHSDRLPETGIPEEAFDLECPDTDFKASVLQEFIFIDERYMWRLNELEDEHKTALQSSTGGWTPDDHFTFQYVMDQYPRDMTNSRALFIDRLRRHLPKKSRAQIVSHEEWWIHQKYYYGRRRDLIRDWQRDRRELINKAKVAFGEMLAAIERHEANEEFRSEQKQICDALYAKVAAWREQKMEAMKLEAEILQQRHLEEQERLRQEEEKEKQYRQEQKVKIHRHQEDQEAQRLAWQAEQAQRLEALQTVLSQQADYDRERVKYREEQCLEKTEEKKKKEAERLEEKKERERVLEALREKVRPHVECDLLRLWSDTEAWQARTKGEEPINIQKPLFDVKSFTANQITSDPRVRLEQKLREAGLQNSSYARQAFAQMAPLHAPRRDMESTVFKYDN